VSLATNDRHLEDWLIGLHWNIQSWHGSAGASNLDAVAAVVRRTNPHVVSLVEVEESWGAPSALAELAGRCGYSWWFVPAFEYGSETPEGGFGNALLSRLPIFALQQWQLIWPPTHHDGTEPSEPRSVVLGKLGTGTYESLWVGSTHLPRDDADARARALGQLSTLVRGLSGKWIICGDFNTPASAWVDSASTLTVAPDPALPTYPADDPVEPIDYCVASPGLRLEAEVLSDEGSDHRPVLFRCSLGEE